MRDCRVERCYGSGEFTGKAVPVTLGQCLGLGAPLASDSRGVTEDACDGGGSEGAIAPGESSGGQAEGGQATSGGDGPVVRR